MQSFEDLIIRQRSKDLYHRIADVLEESKIYFFRDQILRATLSISNNIAE
ncbi:MAG: four helix bundle protein [Candidatus Peribacteria bacterium]|nr:MAG: four helix bundle protein [Candidatus Peribacteria bacterium]